MEESREERFLRTIAARPTRLTYLFIGINLGLFVLMWLAGGMSVTGANHFALVGFGAKENSLIDNQGQYWRLVTSIFLHIGFLHLFFNNYALWIIGQEIEKLYGSARFAALYMLTGIAGSVASYYYYPNTTSAGASGAIFGLFGALATFAFRRQPDIPDFIRKSILRRVFPLIAINLVLSFSIKEIDKAAHIAYSS
jgi:rhomboid protease GluP